MQSQPHRLYVLEVEVPVRRRAVVRLKLHAQPPARFRSGAVGLELDAGPHAPARLPGPLLRRLGVERGDEPAVAQPAEPHDARRQPTLEARMQQSGLQSEEHTSELQSQSNLVCRLLLEKKKN